MIPETCLWYMEYKEKLVKWKENTKALEQGVSLRRQRRGEAEMSYALQINCRANRREKLRFRETFETNGWPKQGRAGEWLVSKWK